MAAFFNAVLYVSKTRAGLITLPFAFLTPAIFLQQLRASFSRYFSNLDYAETDSSVPLYNAADSLQEIAMS